RFPAIAEKFVATNVGSLYVFPNPELVPEKGYSAEAGIMQGLKVGNWKGYVDVAAFYTRYRDMIEFTFSWWNKKKFLNNGGFGFKGLNLGMTEIKGVDALLDMSGNLGALNVAFHGGYTYIYPKALEFDSAYIKAQHVLDSKDTVYKAYLGSDTTTFLKYRYRHLAKADLEFEFK